MFIRLLSTRRNLFLLFASLAFGGGYALLSVASPTTLAQQQRQQNRPAPSPTPPTDDGQTVTVFTRRVRLPISVVDKKGVPVSGLQKNDFQIYEDGKLQEIESFTDESEQTPIYIGVLMDTSGSTAAKMTFQQESAMDFIHTVVRLRKDKVAFMTFDDDMHLLQDFTDKLDLLDRAVRGVKKTGNHTALYDAIYDFCDQKMRTVTGRRALVIVSDGVDTYSRAYLSDAIDIAQRTETLIYAISTKAGINAAVPGVEMGQVLTGDDKKLEKLCNETGGRVFFTGERLALERSFTRIAKELRAQYVVTYDPSNDNYNGQFRKIEVKLVNRPDGARLRAKPGYRALRETVGAGQ